MQIMPELLENSKRSCVFLTDCKNSDPNMDIFQSPPRVSSLYPSTVSIVPRKGVIEMVTGCARFASGVPPAWPVTKVITLSRKICQQQCSIKILCLTACSVLQQLKTQLNMSGNNTRDNINESAYGTPSSSGSEEGDDSATGHWCSRALLRLEFFFNFLHTQHMQQACCIAYDPDPYFKMHQMQIITKRARAAAVVALALALAMIMKTAQARLV